MKILEIRDSKGFFRATAKDEWKEIEAIDKDGLMALLNALLASEVDMDSPDEKKLPNPAQQIIYKSIFEKLRGLQENKSKFKDESDRKYLNEIRKYTESAGADDSVPQE